jgi:hypothetical protein
MDRLAEPSRPRKIEYRWFIAGAEVSPEQFFAELRRLGGRAIVEAVDVPARDARRRETGGRFVATPAGRAALARAAAEGEGR